MRTIGIAPCIFIPLLVSTNVATDLLADHLVVNGLAMRAAALPTAKEQAEWERGDMHNEWTAAREKLAADGTLPTRLEQARTFGIRRNEEWSWLPAPLAG